MSDLDKTPGIGAPRRVPQAQELEQLREEIIAFDENRRLNAVRKLGTLHDMRAVVDLVGRLHIDSSPEVRKVAIEALYAINDARAWPDIAAALGKDDSIDVRSKAAEVLGLSGDQGMAKALVDALRDANTDVRQQAAIGIGRLRDISVVPRLIAGLALPDGKRDAQFEAHYIEALVQLGQQTANRQVVKDIVESAKACKVPSGGYQPDTTVGSFLLQKIVPDRYTAYELTYFYENRISILRRLQSVVFGHDDPPSVLVVVTRAMAGIQDPKCIAALCQIAIQYHEPAVRWLALDSLQKLKATAAGDTLQTVLREDNNWIVRKKAAELLGELQISTACDLLCQKSLDDDNPQVRHQAIQAIGQLALDSAIPTLTELVQRSPDTQARILAVRTLGKIKSEQTIAPLTSALGADRDSEVQREAATSLGVIGAKSALLFLTRVMQDQTRPVDVRLAAAGSAARFGSDEAVNALCDMLSNQEFNIRKTCVQLLADIDTDQSTRCLAKVFAYPSTTRSGGFATSSYNANNLHHLAVEAIVKRRTPTAKSCLGDIICVKADEQYVIENAVDALVIMDPEAALDKFKKAIAAGVNLVAVVDGLVRLDKKQVGDGLIYALGSLVVRKREPDYYGSSVVEKAIHALSQQAPQEALGYLQRALQIDVNTDVAVQGLVKLGTVQAGEALMEVLSSSANDNTKAACVSALGTMKYVPSYRRLQELAASKGSGTYYTREAAQRALRMLKQSGEALPPRPIWGPYWSPE